MLYDGTYCEPALPRPVKKQTEIPSIPISQLYPDEIYPVGFEMQYTVSGSCIDRDVETLSQLPDILAYFQYSCPAPHVLCI